MTEVAVLGLGAMGSRMARNLLAAGFALTVWNRTPEAAAPLLAAGARWADSPREAAAGAAVVMSMLRDDGACREVWLAADTGALAGMAAGSIALESSTVTPGWIAELAARAAERNVAVLEAPVSGSLPQAEAGELVYLVGGEVATLEQARPLLQALGSAIHRVGPLGAGALAKLATNTLLGVQVSVLAELIGLLRRAGAEVPAVLEAVATTPVWSPVASRLSASMLAGDYRAQFPVALMEKDFGYTLGLAGRPDAAPTIAAAREVFRRAMAEGYGDENMTGVARLFD